MMFQPSRNRRPRGLVCRDLVCRGLAAASLALPLAVAGATLAFTVAAPRPAAAQMTDDTPEFVDDRAFLDEWQRRCFDFFWQQTHPATGITADRAPADGSTLVYTEDEAVGSIAAVGFGLTAICIADERGWVDSADAASPRRQPPFRFLLDRRRAQGRLLLPLHRHAPPAQRDLGERAVVDRHRPAARRRAHRPAVLRRHTRSSPRPGHRPLRPGQLALDDGRRPDPEHGLDPRGRLHQLPMGPLLRAPDPADAGPGQQHPPAAPRDLARLAPAARSTSTTATAS